MHHFSRQNTVWVASTLLLAVSAQIPAHAAPVPAKQADSFVDSIGVNTHWYQSNIYGTRYADLKAKLADSGIRYTRDAATGNTFTRAKEVYDQHGIRSILIVAPRVGGFNTPIDATKIDDDLTGIANMGQAVVAIEGPNEYDLPNNHQGDANWVANLQNFQNQLYSQVKAHPTLSNRFVIGPSLADTTADGTDYETVGDLTSSLDYSCIHNYMGARHPETTGWGGAGDTGYKYGSINWAVYELAKTQSPSKPYAVTEGGNNTADPLTKGGWPIEAHGKYVPRFLLSHFNTGSRWTCIYELVDQGNDPQNSEGSYGLLKNDLSEKPAFTAIKNVIALLKDPGATFTPGSLDYALSGSTTDVKSTLLQKRDGKFYLCLWVGKPCWDAVNKTNITVAPQNVTVALPASIRGVTQHELDLNGNFVSAPRTITANATTVAITDRVTVLELSGATGLKAQYFSGMAFNTLLQTQTDPKIDFNWGTGAPKKTDGTPIGSMPSNGFSVIWTGKVVPRHSQAYTFTASADDGVKVWVNRQLAINRWVSNNGTPYSGTTGVLTANQPCDLRVEYYENVGGASAKLEWQSASQAKEVVPQSQLIPAP